MSADPTKAKNSWGAMHKVLGAELTKTFRANGPLAWKALVSSDRNRLCISSQVVFSFVLSAFALSSSINSMLATVGECHNIWAREEGGGIGYTEDKVGGGYKGTVVVRTPRCGEKQLPPFYVSRRTTASIPRHADSNHPLATIPPSRFVVATPPDVL